MRNIKILTIFFIFFGLFAVQSNSNAALDLLNPANNSKCIEKDVTFKWAKQTDAVKYSIKLSRSASFHVDSTTVLNNLTDTTVTPMTILGTNLNSNTKYYWQVTATLASDQILTSSIYSFITAMNPVGLINPANDLCCLDLDIPFKIQTEYTKIDTLRIKIAANSDMSSVIMDTLIINPTITGGFIYKIITMPFYGQNYYWVAYQAANGCWSTMFNADAFHFCTRFGAPSLASPANGMIGIPYFSAGLPFNVRLNWRPMIGTLQYVIELSDNSNFTTKTSYWVNSSDTTALIALPNTYNKTYYWRVFAKTQPITLNEGNLDSCNSIVSAKYSFKTPVQPVAISFPADSANCVPVILNANWTSLTEAQFYQIQVASTNSFHQDSILIDISDIATNSVTLNLPKGIFRYFWRVRVKNLDNQGLWSVIRTFQSTTETPVDIYPKHGTTGIPRAITFSWTPGKANSSYRLMISTQNDFDKNLVDTLITSSQFTYIMPNFSTKYYWKVMSIFGVCQGAWSNTFNFKTFIAPPTLIAPKNDTTKVEPVLVALNWAGAAGTEAYDVDISNDSTFANLTHFERNISGKYVIYDDLKVYTKYFWRVRNRNTEGVSDWSPVWKFTTGTYRPDVPVLVSPLNGAYRLAIDSILLVWNPAFLADKYRLQISEKPDFSTVKVDTATLAVTSFNFKNMVNNTSYYWRVYATNVQGNTAFTDTWTFKTIPVPPSDTVILMEPLNGKKNLINKEQTLKWKTIPNADSYELWIAFDKDFTDIYYKNDKVWTNSKILFNLVPMKTYYWKVRGMNDGGVAPWSETFNFTTEDPKSVSFDKYFSTEILPSPILNNAKVRVTLPETANLLFEVMDINGNIVFVQEYKQMQEGMNEFNLDAKQFVSGTYIYKISSGGLIEFGKFVVSK